MDFFERVFHLNLDGGSGLSEVTLFLAVLIAIVILTLAHKAGTAAR